MKKYLQFLALFAILFSLTARGDTAVTGDGRTIENPTSNGDLKLRVNIGGTKTDALTITGSSGNVNLAKGISEQVTTNTTTGTISDLAWTTPVIRFNAASAVTLNGVVAQADGTKLTIVNDNATVTIKYATGTSANSFVNGSNQDLTLIGNASATFVYSGSRWRLLSGDYQEGTWTPTLHALSGTDPSVTYATNGQRGAYIRNGKNFCFQTQLSWTAYTNGSGGAGAIIVIAGLPVAAGGAAATRSAGAIAQTLVDIPTSYNSLIWRIGSGESQFTLRFNGDNIDDVDVTSANINTFSPAGTKSMTFSGCYGI